MNFGVEKVMEKYGQANTSALSFNGFKNYTQKKEVIKAINSVYMYLKMCSDVYYFEHNDFETDEYTLNDKEKVFVKMDWVVFGLENVLDRTPSQESEQNDLVIAIDNFADGSSKLRIHYPDCYKEKFIEHYNQFDGEKESHMFSTYDEKIFAKLIEDIVKLI